MNIAVRFWLSLFAAGAACVLSNCMPAVSPPVVGDACEAACTRRVALGCLEADLAAQCVPVCQRAIARGLFNATCAAQATNAVDMAACNVRCGR